MQTKQRTCLKCNKLFDSAGPGNRICRWCAQANARLSVTEEQLQKQRGEKRRNGEPMNDASTDED